MKRSQKRRSIALTVNEHGLTVSAPWRSSERRILAAILEAERWILRKLEEWSRHPARRQSWADGDRLHYLGRELRLRVRADPLTSTAVLEDGDVLCLSQPDPDDRAAVLAATVRWLRRHAKAHFHARLAHHAPRFASSLPRLFLSSARTRWGSCNAKGEIRLSWRLIQATPATIDYVVVHELAHLVEMNHSRRFWKLVQDVLPDYRTACAELDRMGPYYMDI